MAYNKLMDAKTVAAAEQALQKLDPTLGALITRQGTIVRPPRRDYFASLVRSMIGQQLSVIAAARIYERFEQRTGLDPKRATLLTEDDVKYIGLSRSKARYIQDLAQHFVGDAAVFNHLGSLSDDDVIKELTAVQGIGVWTAQMFLMFTLARPDVFAPDDVGLQRAIKNVYGFEAVGGRQALAQFADRWKPYRTVACWHLWQSLHNTPVDVSKHWPA